MKNIKALFAVTLMLAVCGCASHYVFEKSQILDDEVLLARCLNAVEKIHSSDCTMFHRVIIEVWGDEYDFNGALAVEKGKIRKGASYGDMGGKIFEFSSEDGMIIITGKPEGVPECALREGMLGDMDFLYAEHRYINSILVRQGVSHFDLVRYRTESDMDVYFFRDGLELPDMGLAVRDSKIVMAVKYSEYQEDAKRALCLPYKLDITNYSWHYKTRIRMFDIKHKE